MGELVLWYGTFAPLGALLGNHWDYVVPFFNACHLIMHHLLSELFFQKLYTNSSPFYQATNLGFQIKTKGRTTLGLSFGSSAIFALKDPPLSAPSSRKVWLYRA
jgi:hypothetical protein